MESSKGTIIVTGANGFLGSAISSVLANSPEYSSDNYGIFLVRDVDRATNLKGVLQKATTPFRNETVAVDLSQLSSVRKLANDINTRVKSGAIPAIRAFILNAAFQEHTSQTFTHDGMDSSFQVNYLSQFLLILLLLQSFDKEHGRIVIVGSYTHNVHDVRNRPNFFPEPYRTMFSDTEKLAKGLWSTPQDDASWLSGFRRYAASQLCKVMFMHELQKRLNDDPQLSNIAVLGVDPGNMGGTLARRGSFVVRVITQMITPTLALIFSYRNPNGNLRTAGKSASDVVRAAFDRKSLGMYPKDIYLNGTQPWSTSEESKDENKRVLLWADSVRYANIVKGDTILRNWQ
ncbi:NAD(P)-binding protein [Thozetella sp. PMI_491]|nr:NAD(P)-binding protein [Thozetella sp. PMI_491]